jgi:hypothetical protein
MHGRTDCPAVPVLYEAASPFPRESGGVMVSRPYGGRSSDARCTSPLFIPILQASHTPHAVCDSDDLPLMPVLARPSEFLRGCSRDLDVVCVLGASSLSHSGGRELRIGY